MKNYFVTMYFEPAYYTPFKSVFIATKEEIEFIQGLEGINIDFGELEGKHSDVSGTIRKKNIKTQELTTGEAEVLIKYIGKQISGPVVLDYIILDELFYKFVDTLVVPTMNEIMKPEYYKWLEEYLINQGKNIQIDRDGEYQFYAYHYDNAILETLGTQTIVEWNNKIKDGLVEKDLEEFKEVLLEVIQKIKKTNEEVFLMDLKDRGTKIDDIKEILGATSFQKIDSETDGEFKKRYLFKKEDETLTVDLLYGQNPTKKERDIVLKGYKVI